VTHPAAAVASAPAACSACGGKLDELGKCERCGAVFGEAYRCPLCHAESDLEANALLNWSCRTCGGPRIPPSAGPSPESEIALLRAARREQLRAGAFRAGAGFALGAGVLALLVTNVVLLATTPPPLAKAFALFASLVPLLLSFLAFDRAKAHRRELERALQQAWLSAATRVVARDGRVTATELARALKLDEARAELLLAEVSVQDFVAAEPAARVRVTELAEPEDLPAAAEQERQARARSSKP